MPYMSSSPTLPKLAKLNLLPPPPAGDPIKLDLLEFAGEPMQGAPGKEKKAPACMSLCVVRLFTRVLLWLTVRTCYRLRLPPFRTSNDIVLDLATDFSWVYIMQVLYALRSPLPLLAMSEKSLGLVERLR